MSYTKIDYDAINWSDGNEGFLYRGHNQGMFEERVLQNMAEGLEAYHGYDDPDIKKATFCSPVYLTGIFYAKDKAIKSNVLLEDDVLATMIQYGGDSVSPGSSLEEFKQFFHNLCGTPLFSNFPIILEINAQKYKDRICESSRGDGLIIQGPICLEDITVLFSSQTDRLDERCPDIAPVKEGILRLRKKLAEICEEIPREGLLDRYKRNPRGIKKKLLRRGFGPQVKDAEDWQYERIKEFIKVIRSKLR
ncbi:hypothetical protein KY346_00320 [Candidatus Woesearchaeota archaeon]|nr:hypothetical protein [Candidatus Woesearchaeota archaeon]